MARHGRHGAPRAAVRAPSAPATGPFGFSRNTKHETRITAFVVARHGAAVARHGRPPSPAPQHRLLGFRQPRITQHVFLLPSGDSKKSNSKPGLQGFHESRDTNHGFFSNHGLLSASMPCPLVPTIARYCPALLGEKILSRQASARRPAFWLDLTAGLHVSPRGEVKWVRGLSGSGASRAEEKGACRCSGRIASLRPSYYEICNTAFTVYPPSDISSGAN